MPSVGLGVREIRVRAPGQIGARYLRFEEAIYILHALGEKTQRTAKWNLELATTRVREVLAGRRRR
jgi:phage-related protein